jgi:CBS domain-containing protein
MASQVKTVQAGYVGPPFEQARVYDAMRIGVVTCRPSTSLRDVARIMLTYQIHAVLVTDMEGDPSKPWGLVSDLDIARAAGNGTIDQAAGDVASTDLATVNDDETLERTAQLMAEHGATHVLAVQPSTGHPVGVISALGLAAALARGS